MMQHCGTDVMTHRGGDLVCITDACDAYLVALRCRATAFQFKGGVDQNAFTKSFTDGEALQSERSCGVLRFRSRPCDCDGRVLKMGVSLC